MEQHAMFNIFSHSDLIVPSLLQGRTELVLVFGFDEASRGGEQICVPTKHCGIESCAKSKSECTIAQARKDIGSRSSNGCVGKWLEGSWCGHSVSECGPGCGFAKLSVGVTGTLLEKLGTDVQLTELLAVSGRDVQHTPLTV